MQNKIDPDPSDPIVLTAEGIWMHAGVAFSNSNLIKLFFRSIKRRNDSSTFELKVGIYSGDVQVEDTAWFVHSIDTQSAPWVLHLSDQTTEQLNPESLKFGSFHQLYCEIKNGTERARFSRSAFQSIIPYFTQEGGLTIGDSTYIISTSE